MSRNTNAEISLLFSNRASRDPCALCGRHCDHNGLAFTLSGTKSLVCDACAQKYAPVLMAAKEQANMHCKALGNFMQELQEHMPTYVQRETARMIIARAIPFEVATFDKSKGSKQKLVMATKKKMIEWRDSFWLKRLWGFVVSGDCVRKQKMIVILGAAASVFAGLLWLYWASGLWPCWKTTIRIITLVAALATVVIPSSGLFFACETGRMNKIQRIVLLSGSAAFFIAGIAWFLNLPGAYDYRNPNIGNGNLGVILAAVWAMVLVPTAGLYFAFRESGLSNTKRQSLGQIDNDGDGTPSEPEDEQS